MNFFTHSIDEIYACIQEAYAHGMIQLANIAPLVFRHEQCIFLLDSVKSS